MRDFRWLWIGQSASLLGDQFYLVGLPWLVLRLTGSALALGMILLAASLPRLALLLIGGAVSDRLSSRSLMIASSVFRSVVCAIATALILLDTIKIWHLLILAAAFGASDAFFFPALKVFLPSVLGEERLTSATALLQGTSMLSQFIGPSLAGLLISTAGTGAAFGVDTASFLVVVICLSIIPRRRRPAMSKTSSAVSGKNNLLRSIRQGIAYGLGHPAIRSLLILIGITEFAFAGPFTVGLVSLASLRFAEGSVAFGGMLSALGCGFCWVR